MADLAIIRHGFGKLDETVPSWRVAIMTKMVNMTKIVNLANRKGLVKILMRLQEALLAEKKS